MAGLALVMLLIIFITGQPEAPATVTTPPAVATNQGTDPDRVREYQDRLRALDAQAMEESPAVASSDRALPPTLNDHVVPAPEVDPIVADRRRREYESLFASNLVLSRRPDAQRPDRGTAAPRTGTGAQARQDPSIDDVAEAVVRATARSSGPAATEVPSPGSAPVDPPAPPTAGTPIATPSAPAGPLQRVSEGTVIDAVLTNRLDGSVAAPVNCMVTNPVYAHSGQQVVIPAGARLLGETKPVQTLGESRLAVVFHRLLMPDGSSVALDQFRGLNQIGDSGLRDRVNRHYWSTFGAAGAVGLVSGFSQLLGTAGIGGGGGDQTVIAGSGADATAQASMQVMNRFLNQLPTVTIREGHRVKVYITSDLNLPAWTPGGFSNSSTRRY